MLTRREDWAERLLAFVRSRERVPFAWGSNDCALHTADAVLAMTDHDFAEPFRGRYYSAFGAAKALLSNGARDLATYVSQVLGEPVAPTLARRGDVMLFAAEEGSALGVVVADQASSAGPDGITWVPRSCWTQAWRVG